MVIKLSQNLNCSITNIWDNLRRLKRIGILDYGNSKNKGHSIILTKEGNLVLKLIKNMMKKLKGGIEDDKKMEQMAQ